MADNTYSTSNDRTVVATSNADGLTPVNIWADPVTHGFVMTGAVTGTVTANAGTNLNTSLLALEAGGNLATVVSNQTNATQQSKLTDGTNIANVLKSDGTAAGQNAVIVGRTYLSVAFTTTTVQAVGSTDAGNYAQVSVQINTQGGSSTVTFQGSNDNTNWVSIRLLLVNETGSSQTVLSSTTVSSYYGPMTMRYFRLNVTGIVSGSTAGVIIFSSAASTPLSNQHNINGTIGSNSATGSAVPANAFFQGVSDGANLRGVLGAANALNTTGTGIPTAALVAQLDDTSPTTITENQFGNLRMTADRSLMVNQVFSYSHISTSATTVIKASAGFIHAISVNTKGTVASTITVYDNTAGSGTVVGVIDSLNLSGAFVLDVSLLTGITIVTTGTVAPDLTVSWR